MEKSTFPVDDAQLNGWCDEFPDTAQALLCVRYALAFNTMDADWLKGTFASTVTYGSQSVLETLQGQEAVWDYLSGKIRTLRAKPARRPRCELGVSETGRPCVLMYQPQGVYDRTWLDVPLVRVDIKTGVNGLAIEIFMITVVPSPASAKRSGIYPGVKEDVHERARRFIRPGDDYDAGLRFSIFLLDGEMSLDLRMMEESEKVMAAFPGSIRSTLITTQRTLASDELDQAGFIGFPSVAVFWKDEIIFRHEGLAFADHLIPEIQKMTALHVVTAAQENKE
ncbi:MAG: hypothetical protein KJ900_01555 [Proteobacteria bacterium]|nr:hypothetical protein [Desulfocapsa sp.]MBU3943131.1 hypothetical protein [Pseudomonadota bacterium]MCG2745709.1 hypothetical protein [Desulfobacteraceae bacterium]MBU3984897.1 hypothetical protein [Pseudomonadota bacterium]MBU4041574.1 hypothetical protein [Pseudomonadota bacterium]